MYWAVKSFFISLVHIKHHSVPLTCSRISRGCDFYWHGQCSGMVNHGTKTWTESQNFRGLSLSMLGLTDPKLVMLFCIVGWNIALFTKLTVTMISYDTVTALNESGIIINVYAEAKIIQIGQCDEEISPPQFKAGPSSHLGFWKMLKVRTTHQADYISGTS